MPRHRSIFPRAKPVIDICSERLQRPTGLLSPILKLVVAASVVLVVMASVMASGRAQDACVSDHGSARFPFDLGRWDSGGQPTKIPAELTPS